MVTFSYVLICLIKQMTMKTRKQNTRKAGIPSILPVLIIPVLFILIGVVISCSTQTGTAYHIVKIAGNFEGACNYSKAGLFKTVYVDSINPTAMLLEAGDLVMVGEFLYYYDNPDEDTYYVVANDSALYLNGQLSSVLISPKYNMLPVFESMDNIVMQGLQALMIGDSIPEEYLPYIEKISTLNPETGLMLSKFNEEMQSVLNLFNPTWVFINGIDQKDFNLLSSLTRTEMISISINDEIISDPLPKMNNLRNLIVGELDKDVIIKEAFLEENPQIENIMLAGAELEDFSFLNAVSNLRSLVISNFEASEMDAAFISAFPDLEVLGLMAGGITSMDALSELSSLQWVMLPPDVSQNDFNSIVENNKELEIVELIGCENISDMSALSQLPGLYGLSVTETLNDSVTLASLANLKYLSLPEEVMQDSAYINSLQNSLPDCTIVANRGLCLGSGWLLLIFPLIILFIFIRRKSTDHVTA